ncbi:hypothetical protein QJQ45_030474 [Haematococcus lacustris]|nr:hypothetical protein QJQ45_030474 [Haematococcus lacustris]
MQQHATRDTSIPNSAAATSTAPICAASQPAMKCGPASLRSHQSSAKRPACSSVSQPLAISERNRVFVIKHRVEGERHNGSLQSHEQKARVAAKSSRLEALGAAARTSGLMVTLLPLAPFPLPPSLPKPTTTTSESATYLPSSPPPLLPSSLLSPTQWHPAALGVAAWSGQPGAGSLERAAWSGQPGAKPTPACPSPA